MAGSPPTDRSYPTTTEACSTAVNCPECGSPAFSLVDAVGDYWSVDCLHCEEMVLSVLDPTIGKHLQDPTDHETSE